MSMDDDSKVNMWNGSRRTFALLAAGSLNSGKLLWSDVSCAHALSVKGAENDLDHFMQMSDLRKPMKGKTTAQQLGEAITIGLCGVYGDCASTPAMVTLSPQAT